MYYAHLELRTRGLVKLSQIFTKFVFHDKTNIFFLSSKMASVAVYSTRSRANDRVGRLRRDMDRSSGYTLSNLVKMSLSNVLKRH